MLNFGAMQAQALFHAARVWMEYQYPFIATPNLIPDPGAAAPGVGTGLVTAQREIQGIPINCVVISPPVNSVYVAFKLGSDLEFFNFTTGVAQWMPSNGLLLGPFGANPSVPIIVPIPPRDNHVLSFALMGKKGTANLQDVLSVVYAYLDPYVAPIDPNSIYAHGVVPSVAEG